MKKKIIIVSVVLMGFVLAVSSNSWAGRERGGERHRNRNDHFQKWDKPAAHKFDRGHGRGYHQNYRPLHRFEHRFHQRHRPNYRLWKFKRHYWRHHRRPVINNYYSSAEGYAAPEEEFSASASVSDSGFSVSVAVNKTN